MEGGSLPRAFGCNGRSTKEPLREAGSEHAFACGRQKRSSSLPW